MNGERDIQMYSDIMYIDYPHIVFLPRPRMSMQDRAAQFSPFAALTGHEEAIDETARLTDHKLELAEDDMDVLNSRIRILLEHAAERPAVNITHFIPDALKEGGRYSITRGNFRRIDESANELVLADGKTIPIYDIYRIDGEIFPKE